MHALFHDLNFDCDSKVCYLQNPYLRFFLKAKMRWQRSRTKHAWHTKTLSSIAFSTTPEDQWEGHL